MPRIVQRTGVQLTSRQARQFHVMPTLGDRQRVVYLELCSADNLTNSELAVRLDCPINTITPRVFELRQGLPRPGHWRDIGALGSRGRQARLPDHPSPRYGLRERPGNLLRQRCSNDYAPFH